jgi:hypothetical protein
VGFHWILSLLSLDFSGITQWNNSVEFQWNSSGIQVESKWNPSEFQWHLELQRNISVEFCQIPVEFRRDFSGIQWNFQWNSMEFPVEFNGISTEIFHWNAAVEFQWNSSGIPLNIFSRVWPWELTMITIC